MPTSIPSGGTAIKDPQDSRSFVFDWDASNLAPSVQISTSTFTLTELHPYAAWSATVAYAVDDQVSSLGNIFLCILAHTNQAPPNTIYWTTIGVVAVLTKDSEARLTAAEATTALQRTVTVDNRVTRLRLVAGTLGQTYDVANTITTSETPAQIKERSFRLLIENQ